MVIFARNSPAPISLLRPPFLAIKVSRGVGYPALRQAPYVALVVPAYGEIVRYYVEVGILGNVQFIGETLPKFRQKVSVFSKWARHRGDVRNSKGFVSDFGKIRGGSFHIGRKAAKAKRRSNSSKNASKFLEELSKHQAMRIEMDLKQQEHDMAIQLEYAKEREYVRKEREYVREQNIEKKDRETMAMDTSHMSPETKQFWKLERRDVLTNTFS
ncbi:hypothetical protein L3X38_015160 [Prunus dulcis]|uniref:No apical meristem-associated C-terminal domain-containing protein n=1 Tax=Prunus dulcis TaxID=3755 RepID=A0AAD4WRY9_PRUDU|nr:hypothetical protein L3X38_015160 [Prunus dulcis]